MLGYDVFEGGPTRAIVLHDWLSDSSSWDGVRAMLRPSPITWAFMDLRGYGRSRHIAGEYTVVEAASDVLACATVLGWDRFAIVGHSMSSLIALHLAQVEPERVARAVAIAPPPPRGAGYDDPTLAALRALSLGDDDARARFVRAFMGERLTEGWTRFKVERWRRTSAPEAVAGYLRMFGRAGLPDPTRALACPLLVVTGERDAGVMRREAAVENLAPLAEQLVAVEIPGCGHYPMQETPPALLAILERFLCS